MSTRTGLKLKDSQNILCKFVLEMAFLQVYPIHQKNEALRCYRVFHANDSRIKIFTFYSFLMRIKVKDIYIYLCVLFCNCKLVIGCKFNPINWVIGNIYYEHYMNCVILFSLWNYSLLVKIQGMSRYRSEVCILTTCLSH